MSTIIQTAKHQYCPHCNKMVTASRELQKFPFIMDLFLGIFTIGLWWVLRLFLFILGAFGDATRICPSPPFICPHCKGATRKWY